MLFVGLGQFKEGLFIVEIAQTSLLLKIAAGCKIYSLLNVICDFHQLT